MILALVIISKLCGLQLIVGLHERLVLVVELLILIHHTIELGLVVYWLLIKLVHRLVESVLRCIFLIHSIE